VSAVRGKIVVMLFLAVFFGGASLVAARLWIDGQASRRLAALEAQAPHVQFATIVVASEPLRFGTPLTTQNLKTIPWPESDLPDGAFAKVEDLTGAEPRTALFPVEASEPILAAKITGPGERPGLARLIADGHRAVTVRVDDVAGVAGFVLPGDRVDVVLTVETRQVMSTDVVLQNVKVLSVDQIADERAAEPVVVKAVTLEVDPAGAQKISLAQTIGTISLSLRGSGDDRPANVATVTPSDIRGGSATRTASATPARSIADMVSAATAKTAKPPAPRPEPIDTSITVSVTRAMVATDYKVPAGAEIETASTRSPDEDAAEAADPSTMPPAADAPSSQRPDPR
jgi:pilus assembly protein CpaB